jgi:hypothetical protein
LTGTRRPPVAAAEQITDGSGVKVGIPLLLRQRDWAVGRMLAGLLIGDPGRHRLFCNPEKRGVTLIAGRVAA